MRMISWSQLHPVVRRLLAARAVRSVAQGVLTINFVLYLAALHWTAADIGLIVSATTLVASGLALWGGMFSDRSGRKRFLLAYQAASVVLCGAILLDPARLVLIAAAVLLGFGLGGNAAAGPFTPVAQAWLAQNVPQPDRGRVFSLNSAVGFVGMALGAVAGGGIPVIAAHGMGVRAYDLMFGLNMVMAAVNFVQIVGLREQPPEQVPAAQDADPSEREVRRTENRNMTMLSLISSVAALGMGLFAQILPYWFSIRYGVTAEAIGPVYALAFLLAAGSSLITGEVTARVGLVRAIVAIRLTSVLFLIALPFMPTFAWAAVVYTARAVLNRGSIGARQAFSVSIVRDGRRGLAGSLNTLSQRLPSAIGPAIGGWLIGIGLLALPFLLGAGLQMLYAVMFFTAFRNYEAGNATHAEAAASAFAHPGAP